MQNEFRTGLVDGLVISGVGFGARWVEDLIDGPHPSVLIGRHPTRTDVASVQVDNTAGAREAVAHLIASGCRRVAIILGPPDRTDSHDRLAGYHQALTDHGLAPDPTLVAQGDFTMDSGYTAMQQLLPHQPDGVFAANDLMAVGALRVLQESGVRVPDDMGVAGFDDLTVATTADPPLTTIRHDIRRVGEAAVDMLLRLLDSDEGERPESVIVPAPLVARRSTRPVPVATTGAPEQRGA
jgi:DNA-binding LacI/PurR family transcriptional regulator